MGIKFGFPFIENNLSNKTAGVIIIKHFTHLIAAQTPKCVCLLVSANIEFVTIDRKTLGGEGRGPTGPRDESQVLGGGKLLVRLG